MTAKSASKKAGNDSADFRKVAGGSRVVREPDLGGGKAKGTMDFASPVDVNVVGPTRGEVHQG